VVLEECFESSLLYLMTILIHEELVNTTIACGSALRAEKWDGSACCDKINNRCCVSGLQKC